MRFIGFTAALALVSNLVPSSPALGQEYDLPIREHVYANGLRLLVLERPGDPRVAAKIFTDFGGLVEEPGALGAAHFLEHLMFKGTPTLGTTDWAAERPVVDRIEATERELIAELNRARNALTERGVFHDYAHARSTPRADSLRQAIARLDSTVRRTRDNGAMMKWYQAFGGTGLTATTEQEYMKFDINLPAERVELFFRVEADRMRNTVFREFDQERMILVEQRYGDLNRATTPYYEALGAAMGVIHPVYWPEGYLTDFPRYTRAYERALYERYFVPNNTTLVLIGGVRLEAMIPLGERYFGSMSRSAEPAATLAIEPVPAAERRLIFRSVRMAPRVEVRHGIPGVGHPDRPHFDVMASVLQRLLERTMVSTGLAQSVDANTRVVHTARFGVPASLNLEVILRDEANAGRAEQAILDAMALLKRGGVSEPDLRRSKKLLRTEWHRIAADPDRLGFEIGHFETMDSWRTLPRYLAAREETTADDLRRLAERYFTAENRTVGIVRRPEEPTRHEGTGR